MKRAEAFAASHAVLNAPSKDASGQVIGQNSLARQSYRVDPVEPAKRRSGRIDRYAAQWIARGALILGDLTTYLLAYVGLRMLNVGEPNAKFLLALAAVCSIAIYSSVGLYPGCRLLHHEHLRRRVISALEVIGITSFGSVLLFGDWQSTSFIVLSLIVALGAQFIVHRIARWLLWCLGCWGEAALIIGSPNKAPLVSDYFMRNWQYGLIPVPISSPPAMEPRAPRVALIAGDILAPEELTALRQKHREIILLADIPSMKISGLRPADLEGKIGLQLTFSDSLERQTLPHRVFDLAIAVPAALLLAPVALIVGAAIYAVDPGPIIYRQTREGLKGKSFHVVKLRTMYKDAEQRLASLLRTDLAARTEWSTHFKLKNDPRVLPVVGNFLRMTSLDEIPQLLNVIAGEMRIVGPRPFPEYHLGAMEPEFRAKRHTVTPGLTGLWQISARSDADIDLQQRLDDFYINNRSLWFDCDIILNTFSAVFGRRGAR